MMILAQIYLIICTLFLAGKDASSYLLKDHTSNGKLTYNRIKRWHRDGAILNILFIIPLFFLVNPYLIIIYAALIRLSFFDLGFNKWANIPITFLGSTAKADKIFIKIFGREGAIKKSIAFFIILVVLNILLK